MSLPKLSSILAAFFFLFSGAILTPTIARADNLGLVSFINQYRQSQGLSTLADDQKITNAACWMGSDMAAKSYFSHTDSLGRDPFTRMDAFGAVGNARAENIASLTNQPNSAEKVFDGWKNSPGHNANMLGPYSRIGVGFGYNASNKTYYWVADFSSGTTVSLSLSCGGAAQPPPTPAPKRSPKPVPTTAPPSTPPVLSSIQTQTPSQVLDEKNFSSSSAKTASASSKADGKPTSLVKNSFDFRGFFLTIIVLFNTSLLGYLVFLLWKNHRRTKFV